MNFPRSSTETHKSSTGHLAEDFHTARKTVVSRVYMKRFCELCAKARIVAAEAVSTIVFFVFLYVAARYEITHLLSK